MKSWHIITIIALILILTAGSMYFVRTRKENSASEQGGAQSDAVACSHSVLKMGGSNFAIYRCSANDLGVGYMIKEDVANGPGLPDIATQIPLSTVGQDMGCTGTMPVPNINDQEALNVQCQRLRTIASSCVTLVTCVP